MVWQKTTLLYIFPKSKLFQSNCIAHESVISGLIDHVHLRQSERILRTIVTQEAHYFSDHESVNVTFKNFQWYKQVVKCTMYTTCDPFRCKSDLLNQEAEKEGL